MSVRKILYKYWWFEKWWIVRDFFKPKQKWLTKKIPNHWCDKVELIRIVLFESLVHFVDEEDAMNFIDWEESSPRHIKAKAKILLAYDIIKNQIPAQEKLYEDAYKNREPRSLKNFDDWLAPCNDGIGSSRLREFTPVEKSFYEHVNDIEREKERLTQKACKIIVEVRPFMWT